MQPAESVVAEVVRLVSISPQKSISGSQLAGALRASFPDFSPLDYSTLNFRAFLRSHAAQIIEVARSGGDIIYGLRGEQPAPSVKTEPPQSKPARPMGFARRLSSEVWRTFSSPSNAYRLYGHPESGTLRIVRRNEIPLLSPWVQIPACSSAKHLQIARDFINSLSDEKQRSLLTQALNVPAWWLTFFRVATQLGIGQQWAAFRGTRILQEFFDTLQNLGIPFRPGETTDSQRESGMRVPSPIPIPAATEKGSLLRRLAISAVQRMTTAELRALSLPLGYIVDELREE